MELRPIMRDEINNVINRTRSISVDGELAFICPYCGAITYVPTLFNYQTKGDLADHIEFEYNVTCCECNGDFATHDDFDPNIVEPVVALNKKGYTTKFSCEGHVGSNGYWTSPYIAFKDDSIKEKIKDLPNGWKWDDYDEQAFKESTLRFNIPCDETGYFYDESWKSKAIEDLTEWVDNLPFNAYGIYAPETAKAVEKLIAKGYNITSLYAFNAELVIEPIAFDRPSNKDIININPPYGWYWPKRLYSEAKRIMLVMSGECKSLPEAYNALYEWIDNLPSLVDNKEQTDK